jgi:hypothetical protein
MRVCFWTDISNAGDHPEREYQRIYCWAAAVERMGHNVCLAPVSTHHPWEKYLTCIDRSERADVGIVVASRAEWSMPAAKWPITVIAQPVGRIVITKTAWSADFIIGSPNDTLPDYREFAAPRIAALGRRHLGVHFQPFERTLAMFDRDGMLGAYIDNDLTAIRNRYSSPRGKVYDIGYRGNTVNAQTPGEPIRSQVFSHYVGQPHFEFQYARSADWYDRTADYLAFLSECRLTMALVGDRVKTHRHVEAPMMGSPVCVVRGDGQLDVTPAHDDANSVMLADWFDEAGALAGLERAERDYDSLMAASDTAYCDGWSLTGQMRELFRRIEGG